jgi:AcrR family transcriptional regulator
MDAKERILNAGREILASEGLRAITTQAIAQRARISKKTLYRAFSSKDELLEAIVVSMLEGHLERWDRILESKTSAIDRIEASLQFVGEFLPLIQQQILNQVQSVAPQLWKTIDVVRMKRLERMAALVREAQSDGHIRPDLDSGHWALFLMGTVSAVFNPDVVLRAGVPMVALFHSLQTIYYDALLTDEGRRHIERQEIT